MDNPTLELMNRMNKMRAGLFILLAILNAQILFCQSSGNNQEYKRGDVRIMFYNTENFFDTQDDSLKNDGEFLPEGKKSWTPKRYRLKALNLYKTIVAVGGARPPEVVCFAEIENRYVLQELTGKTPLEKYPYEIVHFDSPDRRGIDVGLIYRRDVIECIYRKAIPVTFPDNPQKATRDILYAKFLVNSTDTLHLFVNHWPSRMGGIKKSEPFRSRAATILRETIDSLLAAVPCSQIVITGDFNDEPINTSIKESLKAREPSGPFYCNELYNLSEGLQESCKCGTYRYQASWDMLDQFMVSGALLNSEEDLTTCEDCLHIADFDFLLTDDEKYGGKKPLRTYAGPVYKGGFSDHLPVYLDIFF